MHQLLFFKIENNRTGKSVKIECRIEMIDSISKPVTFIVNKNKLQTALGQSTNIFGRKLEKTGTLIQKIRVPEAMGREAVLEKLKAEFGGRFTVSVVYERGASVGSISPKKKVVGGGKRVSVKKAAAKKAVRKKVAKKSIKKKTTERFSNFSGNFDKSEEVVFESMPYEGLGEAGDVAVEKNYDTVEVLFATDRNKTESLEPNDMFGNTRNLANCLVYGICQVSIPPEHEKGNIERPSWFDRLLFSNPENPEKHIMISDLKIKAELDFLNILNSKIKTSANNDAFIFIHGFNVSFQEAVRRTAQIAHDLSFKGTPISYSWPSLSEVRGYMSDEDSVIWTVPHLKQVIKNVLNDKNLAKLHLIAHSMGNRALTNAIKELKAEGFDLSKINQIILAAPDIDSNVFTDVIVPGIKGVSQQITLYASSKDKALKTSRTIRSGIIRAGESGKNIVVVDGVSTIDASKVDTNFLGHGYFAETQALINDIFLILEHSFIPSQRNLKQKDYPPKGFYWLFPA
jgi:esterase/lipase superfamily enzyme